MTKRLSSIRYFYNNKIPLCERGKGWFHLGDTVEWRGHIGTVVEIVPYGMYPSEHPKLTIKGYYREFESYIVQDDRGKRWWPRVGNLHLLPTKETK